jgi:hypothetical protein
MPIGKGNRIVKPPTAKQRAQAKAYGAMAIIPAADTVPKSSWWTEPKTREEFDQAAAAQRTRMQESTFGKFKGVNA